MTIYGAVTAQHAPQTVTLRVYQPNQTIDTFTTTTQADKTYSVNRTYNLAGNYSVVAHVDADGEYVAKDSAPRPFTINLQDRTITVDVSFA